MHVAERGIAIDERDRPAGEIPVVRQMTETDCGAACLVMAVRYFGGEAALKDVRDRLGVGRDGVSARMIAECARSLLLDARGVKVEVEELAALPKAAILHWGFKHFVIFERISKKGVHIVDPAHGRRIVELEEVKKQLTGIAVVLERSAAFLPAAREFARNPARARAGVKRLGTLLWKLRRYFGRVLLLSAVSQILLLSIPGLTGSIVEKVVPRQDERLLAVLAVGVIWLVSTSFMVSLVRAHLVLEARTLVDAEMTSSFLEHMMRLPFVFFQRRSAGDLLMRLGSNATIREVMTTGVLSAVFDGVMAAGYLALVFALSTKLALLLLALGALQLATLLLMAKRQNAEVAREISARAELEGYQVEMLNGVETIKALGAERRALGTWSNRFVDVLNASLRRGAVMSVFEAIMAAQRVSFPLLVLLLGGYLVVKNEMSIGSMLAMSALAVGFLNPIASLVSSALSIHALGAYWDRIEDVYEEEPEDTGRAVKTFGRLSGRVRLERVSFKYGPYAPEIVSNIDLEIEPGEKVAIVGRTGSGKSTVAKLLAGIIRPTSGRVLYDQHDAAELDPTSLRRQLGVVTQKPFLFASSIRRNISLDDPDVTLDQVEHASKYAQIYSDIAAMPMGFETIVADGGSSLSGGQMQRIALARAIVRKPAVLVLDEATSALDAMTEYGVQLNLSALKMTQIIVAHRLSTVRSCDRIVVVQNGQIVQIGTHEQLMRAGGYYRELVTSGGDLQGR